VASEPQRSRDDRAPNIGSPLPGMTNNDALPSKDTRHLRTDRRYSCALRLRAWCARRHQIRTVSSDDEVSDGAVSDTGIALAEASCRLLYCIHPIWPSKRPGQRCYGACTTDGRRRNECWIRAGDGKFAWAAAAQQETSVVKVIPPHYLMSLPFARSWLGRGRDDRQC
jgi:hypothetical protein